MRISLTEQGAGKLYTYRYTVTTRMTSAFKVGSDESRFNVSLIVRDKVTRQCPQTTTFEEKGEPKQKKRKKKRTHKGEFLTLA